MKLVGIERVNYKNKMGSVVDGYRLYMGSPLNETNNHHNSLFHRGVITMRWNALHKRFEAINYFCPKAIFDRDVAPLYNDPNLFEYDVEATYNEYGQIATINFK